MSAARPTAPAARARRVPLFVLLLGALVLIAGGCDSGDVGATGDGGGPAGDGAVTDGFGFGDTGSGGDGGGGGASCVGGCPSGQACFNGSCVEDKGPCKDDNDCQGDSFCSGGRCVPYGPNTKLSDPNCKNDGFAAEKLELPKVKCTWTEQPIRMSPMVADLDGDKKPEIIFVTHNGTLVAISGDKCKTVFKIATAGLALGSNPAIGDLDGDGKPEIVGIAKGDFIRVFDNKGKVIATATTKPLRTYSEQSGGPAIANTDGKGNPEIVYGGMVLRLVNGKLNVVFNKPVNGGYRGVFSTVADVDLDGRQEIISGNTILDAVTGADKTPANIKKLKGGHVAIAQFDKSTPEPEIVIISSLRDQPAEVRIFHPVTGKVIFGPYTFGQRNGGPPTVADFDGDGEPEVAAAGYVGYAVFDMECAATPLPSFCHSPGMRWFKVTQDKSSGVTGSSVFDFNGDGAAEVVYRDECWLRVYDGKTGKVLFASAVTSGTKMELPAIADTDNDGHADIVVSSDNYTKCSKESELNLAHTGNTQGIIVLQDPKNRWMASRPVWNQHAYHITNINDDLTVPKVAKNNWATWNNFRQNTQGILKKEEPASDITGASVKGLEPGSDCKTTWVLQARVCNRGTNKAGPGVRAVFYDGDPRTGGNKLCETTTSTTLDPGKCEAVKCTWQNPTKNQIDLWVETDADGREVECKERNNLLHVPTTRCDVIG